MLEAQRPPVVPKTDAMQARKVAEVARRVKTTAADRLVVDSADNPEQTTAVTLVAAVEVGSAVNPVETPADVIAVATLAAAVVVAVKAFFEDAVVSADSEH